MLKPVARVIAYSKFLGFPEELYPLNSCGTLDLERVKELHQDEGSDSARLIECAGRCCYDSLGKGRDSASYHEHILEVAHGSVAEHATISFLISNISRGCSHELVRHRHFGISQRSTRYVEESESEWAWHPLFHECLGIQTWEEISRFQKEAQRLYQKTRLIIETELIAKGSDKLAARKQARGAARGLLGNALSTELVWTGNIRALRGFLEQRATDFADAEIRLLADEIFLAAKEVCPEYFGDYEQSPASDGIGFIIKTDHRKI